MTADTPKRKGIAYLLLLCGGVLGLHSFYLRQWRLAVCQVINTAILVGVGSGLAWVSLGAVLAGTGGPLLSLAIGVWVFMATILVFWLVVIDAATIPERVRRYNRCLKANKGH